MKHITTLILLMLAIPAFSQEVNCPSAKEKYLEKNPDVKKAGMDAWSHYNSFGKREGRLWPKCDDLTNEKTGEVTVKSNLINTNGCIGKITANINTNSNLENLELDFKRYDSLKRIINRFENFGKFEGININVNYITAQSVWFYQRKKLYCFKIGSWLKHKDKLIKMGFDEARLNERYKWCKLYFSYDEKTDRYNELPYYELNQLKIQNLGMNQFAREYYNCALLKKKFNKFVLKNIGDVIEIAEDNKDAVLFSLTNLHIDDADFYQKISWSLNDVRRYINDLENKYKISLNEYYYYWGQKLNNSSADGYGYIVNKESNALIIDAYWQKGIPEKIYNLYLYKDNKQLILKGKTKVFHIIESPNNTNSKYYFGAFLDNYNNFSWVRHGFGEYYWENSKYLGNWKYGERTGNGIFTYNIGKSNERYYEGEFLNNNYEGMGKLYKCSDTINRRFTVEWDGLWKNGGFVKSKNDLITEENQRIENAKIEAENQAKMAIEEEKKKVEELNCSMTFSDPKVKIQYIDNRVKCCCCSDRYAKYEDATAKNTEMAKVEYLSTNLVYHILDNNYGSEHFANDVSKLTQFAAKQYEHIFAYGISVTATMYYTMAKTGLWPRTKNFIKVNKYNVTSKFCSLKCENYCYGQCN
ncbi:MAG: hypothetical protein RLZZ318_201 [Bacteroidota bacterium]|jgi:hypothetical protein